MFTPFLGILLSNLGSCYQLNSPAEIKGQTSINYVTSTTYAVSINQTGQTIQNAKKHESNLRNITRVGFERISRKCMKGNSLFVKREILSRISSVAIADSNDCVVLTYMQ